MPPRVSDQPGPAKGQPNSEAAPATTVALSDAQFAELKELLRPGYELAQMYLDGLATDRAAAGVPLEPPPEPIVPNYDPNAAGE